MSDARTSWLSDGRLTGMTRKHLSPPEGAFAHSKDSVAGDAVDQFRIWLLLLPASYS